MDPFGDTVGIFGLAGVLSNCIESFELIQACRHYSVDYEIVFRKFLAQRARLIIWGMATGIIGARDYDTALDQPYIYSEIQGSLNSIKLLFENGDDLVHKYGLQRVEGGAMMAQSQAALHETFDQFGHRLAQNQARATPVMTIRWAIADRNKFRLLVADLKDLIDTIHDLTQSVGSLTEQPEIVDEQIRQARAQDNPEAVLVLQEVVVETSQLLAENRQITMPPPGSDMAGSSRVFWQDDEPAQHMSGIHARPDSSTTPASGARGSSGEDVEPRDQEQTVLLQNAVLSSHPPQLPSNIEAQIRQARLDRFERGPGYNQATIESRDMRMSQLLSEDSPLLLAGSHGLGKHSKRVLKEMQRQAQEMDTPFISFSPINQNFSDILGIFRGPPDSPYEGGIFFVRIYLPHEYPLYEPIFKVLTPIYHPNIDEQGRICAFSRLSWSTVLTIRTALVTLSGLLSLPKPEEPLRLDVARQYLRDRERFNQIAEAYTALYATGERPQVGPPTAEYFWWDHAHVDDPNASEEERRRARYEDD